MEKEIEGLKICLENFEKSADYWERQAIGLKKELADLGNQLTEARRALWREEKETAELRETLAEKEKEIGELKELREKARDIGRAIFEWQSKLAKSVSILNQSKKAFKSGLVAEARKIVEEVAERMLVRIRTWSI